MIGNGYLPAEIRRDARKRDRIGSGTEKKYRQWRRNCFECEFNITAHRFQYHQFIG